MAELVHTFPLQPRFDKLEEVGEAVDKADGLLTVSMLELREAVGAGRLGKHIPVQISRSLESLGLGHVPRVLPQSQNSLVRIYRRGSEAERLLKAAMEPGSAHDEYLLEMLQQTAADKLAQIREIVCS